MKKSSRFENIRQAIFSAKTDKEKKMWEAVLKRLEDRPPVKLEKIRKHFENEEDNKPVTKAHKKDP